MKYSLSIAILFAGVFSGSALAQSDEITYKSTEVHPGIFMLEGVGGFAGGNLGLLTGTDGNVLIDDGMPPLYAKIRAEIKRHVDGEIDFLINTHVHGDHIGNNESLGKAGATIFAHDNIRRRMIEDGVTGPDGQKPPAPEALPEVTFSDSVTFHLNGHRAYVFHVSHAHTDGDAVIHFPDADVIHTGDVLFNGMFPYIDFESGGSVDGYLKAQERVLAHAGADTKIIPGHGPLASKADLEAARDMLVDSRDRVRKLVKAGKSEAEILAMNPLAAYHDKWNWGFITTERMTKALIQDAGASH